MRARGWIIGLVVANEIRGVVMAPAASHAVNAGVAHAIQPLLHASLPIMIAAYGALAIVLLIVLALLGLCAWRAAHALYTAATRLIDAGRARTVVP